MTYLMGHGIMGFERSSDGAMFFFMTDAQSTVRDIVNSAGEVVQSYEFDPHGVPMPGSGAGSVTSAKSYHGGLSVNDDLADTGLYLMGHRFWAPDLGRFISRDPMGFAGGPNLYGSAFGNNPLTFVDPSGLKSYFVLTGAYWTNFYQGHTAIYIDGFGLFSLAGGSGGINFHDNVSLLTYMKSKAGEGVMSYRLFISPEQEKQLGLYLSDLDADCNKGHEIESYCKGLTCAGTIDMAFEWNKLLPETEISSKYLPVNLWQRLLAAGYIKQDSPQNIHMGITLYTPRPDTVYDIDPGLAAPGAYP